MLISLVTLLKQAI